MRVTNDSGEQQNGKQLETLTDSEIITERRVPRRSFLTGSGVVLAGLAGIVSGGRASAQDDPDKRPKPEDPDKRPDDSRKPDDRRRSDDQRKPDDSRKPDDTQKRPDQPRPDDPHF